MPGTLTRRKLYELVWSKPRTTLAREMGVSDVWIGKQCRALNVPAPPPGYWAHRAAGGQDKGRYARPPLSYTLAERMEEDHSRLTHSLDGFQPAALAQPVPQAPVWPESLEQAVVRYAGLARSANKRDGATARHPIVQRLLDEDARRVAEEGRYAGRMPLYQGAGGADLLLLLDRLAWHWTDCGFRVQASRSHDVVLSVGVGGASTRFEVCPAASAPALAGRPRREAGRAQLALWLDRDPQGARDPRRPAPAPVLLCTAGDKDAVDTMTRALLAHWEQAFREEVQWRYRRALDNRQWAIQAAEKAARLEREQREAAARALLQKRLRLMLRAVNGARRADELRALVAQIGSNEAEMAVDALLLARWKAWVLGQADEMDLRGWDGARLQRWLEEFDLDGDAAAW